MADTIKSALFVDYDSLHRSLRATRRETAERLAQRAAMWVAAIESGKLVSPRSDEGQRRRVLIRRCYADPRLLGRDRAAFVAAGFEVVDCAPLEGRERNSADVHMALDTIDALGHPTGYDEFILLSADTDLSPLLLRLRAHNRLTSIYASSGTSAAYKAIADSLIEEPFFVAFLTGDAGAIADLEPVAEPRQRASGAERAEIEAIARKIHNATSVPLFSPRTFADLFAALTDEISARGYHFQNTAENVAEKLVAAGRNVSRRQVVFVVKGLALKGHVFSTTDTPDRLADVFREQVLYLVNNAGLELDSRELALLPAWISGRAGTAVDAEPVAEEPAAKAARKRVVRPPSPPVREAAKDVKEPPAAREATPPARETPPSAKEAPPREKPEAQEPRPARQAPVTPIEEIKAAAASRLAAIAKPTPIAPKPGLVTPGRPSPISRQAGQPAKPAGSSKAAKPAAASQPRPAPAAPPAEPNKEALESSILAAIAQAVDVLVEDGGNETKPPEPSAPATAPAETPEPVAAEGDDAGDIGDEIQKIIASYSRARQQGGGQ